MRGYEIMQNKSWKTLRSKKTKKGKNGEVKSIPEQKIPIQKQKD